MYTTIMASHSIHISIARSPPQPTRSLASHSLPFFPGGGTFVCAGSFHRARRIVASQTKTRPEHALDVNAPLRGRSSCWLHLVRIPSATVGKRLPEETYLERERERASSLFAITPIPPAVGAFFYFIIRFLGLGDATDVYAGYDRRRTVLAAIRFENTPVTQVL